MTHHTLTLNYGPDGFQPDKDDLPVETQDTISFQLGVAPVGSTFKVTMDDPAFFSASEVADSKTKIMVLEAVNTSYQCHLFDGNGNPLSRPGQAGGHIRPGGR